MDRKYNVSVIGSGALSLSIAGQISANGGKVTFIDTKASGDALIRLNTARKLYFTGVVNYESEIINFTADYESLSYADVIVITVSASDFHNISDIIVPKIKDGHRIIFFPGSFGAMLLKKRLEKDTGLKNVCLSESVSYPYVTELIDFNVINVHSIKNELKLASCPYHKSKELCDFYNGFFNIFISAQSFLETSLENINSVLHPLPILLNVGMIEKNGKSFKHFIDGVTPTVGSLMDRMDRERLLVGNAYDTSLLSSLKQLNSYYGPSGAKNLYEYLAGEDSPYQNISGFGMESRYILEDIPYLVVPAASLGRAAHVEMPVFELVIRLAGLLLNKDFYKEGLTIKQLGLEGLSIREIQKAFNNFN